MLKLSLLAATALLAISCNNSGEPDGSTVHKDSTAIVKQDTASPDQSVPVGKHEAYNNEIKELPASLAQFVPAGYTALDTTSGDLNLDQYTDMIMVLKKNDEDSTSDVNDHPEKRPLLILTGQPDHTYKLAARSDNAVYCIDCGGMMGDPFMNVVIKKGYFSVEHYGGSAWRWTRTVTFKYEPADNYWFLHKDGGDSFHSSDPEKVETKVKTTKDFGKVRFDQFDIYKED